jgi:hypothetical protein
MPFSQSGQISSILQYCESLQPASVLDVGVGMGTYGILLRTHLEHLNLFKIEGAQGSLRPRAEWGKRIDGIEGFAGYLTPVHAYAYNHIFVGDALEKLSKLPDAAYELVMAIDIVEHFTKADGLVFLKECRRVCSRACLVSTPKEFIHQEIPANPFEDHRSHWLQKELEVQGFANTIDDEVSWVMVHSKKSVKINSATQPRALAHSHPLPA